MNRFHQQALLQVARYDGGPGLASFADARPGVQQQLAFHLLGLGGVAFVAFVHQDRADARLKKLELGCVWLGLGGDGDRRQEGKNDKGFHGQGKAREPVQQDQQREFTELGQKR